MQESTPLKIALQAMIFSTIFLMIVGCGGEKKSEIAAELPPQSYGEEESNVDLWIESMEVGSRELYSARFEVIKALGLTPGEKIADIGAGTGLYSLLFADSVTESGRVFAVDIEPRFLKMINQRVSDGDFANVTAVLSQSLSVTLPDQSVDMVFISDTYNYFENPQAIMKTVISALKPGGRLILLDFDISEEQPRMPGTQHVRVGKQAIVAEIESIGFEYSSEIDVPGLKDTYMLEFRRPE